MEKYIILMTNGSVPVEVSGVNLKTLVTLINKHESIAVRIGKKSLTKNLIAVVAKIEAITESDERNLKVVVMNTALFTAAQTDEILDTLTDDINKKSFALLNDEILINRAYYQYAEVDDRITDQTNGTNKENEIVQNETIDIDNEGETQADA